MNLNQLTTIDMSMIPYSYSNQDELNFLYLDNQDLNIEFTCEIEHNGHFPFLDIEISRDKNSFVSSVIEDQLTLVLQQN